MCDLNLCQLLNVRNYTSVEALFLQGWYNCEMGKVIEIIQQYPLQTNTLWIVAGLFQ